MKPPYRDSDNATNPSWKSQQTDEFAPKRISRLLTLGAPDTPVTERQSNNSIAPSSPTRNYQTPSRNQMTPAGTDDSPRRMVLRNMHASDQETPEALMLSKKPTSTPFKKHTIRTLTATLDAKEPVLQKRSLPIGLSLRLRSAIEFVGNGCSSLMGGLKFAFFWLGLLVASPLVAALGRARAFSPSLRVSIAALLLVFAAFYLHAGGKLQYGGWIQTLKPAKERTSSNFEAEFAQFKRQVQESFEQLRNSVVATNGTISAISNQLQKAILETEKNLLHRNLTPLLNQLEVLQREQKRVSSDQSLILSRISEIEAENSSICSRLLATKETPTRKPVSSRIDYALPMNGARVIKSLTSPTFCSAPKVLQVVGIGSCGKDPINALISDFTLGNCWSFAGSLGQLVIQLGKKIAASSFSIEHIAPESCFSVSSAPKQVQIFSMDSISAPAPPIFLAEIVFDPALGRAQNFASTIQPAPTEFLLVKILSNHGNRDFTCLYKFGVFSE